MKRIARAEWKITDPTRSVAALFIGLARIVDQLAGLELIPTEDLHSCMSQLRADQQSEIKRKRVAKARTWLEKEEDPRHAVFTLTTPRGKIRLTRMTDTRYQEGYYTLDILDCFPLKGEKLAELLQLMGPPLELEVKASQKEDDIYELLGVID